MLITFGKLLTRHRINGQRYLSLGELELEDNANPHAFGTPSRKERHQSYKFVDRVQIEVQGGKGGNGCVSHEVLSPGCKRPNGGNGGKGGSVFVQADVGMCLFIPKIGDGLTGKRGKDVIIKVPVGTIVKERISEEFSALLEDEGYDGADFPIVEMNSHNDMLMVAEGGQEGVGNKTVAGSQAQRGRSLPASKIPGRPGQARPLVLELKLIADVGLVGFPNAGKSTLLRALSRAQPKVAPYPFTTLHPSVGIVQYSDLERISVADIPGLIEGAHADRGLGHDFLRHVERTKMLLFVVDAAGSEGRRPAEDLKCLLNELKLYDEDMLTKPRVVFGNKADLQFDDKLLDELRDVAHSARMDLITGSAHCVTGIAELAKELRLMMTITSTSNE